MDHEPGNSYCGCGDCMSKLAYTEGYKQGQDVIQRVFVVLYQTGEGADQTVVVDSVFVSQYKANDYVREKNDACYSIDGPFELNKDIQTAEEALLGLKT